MKYLTADPKRSRAILPRLPPIFFMEKVAEFACLAARAHGYEYTPVKRNLFEGYYWTRDWSEIPSSISSRDAIETLFGKEA